MTEEQQELLREAGMDLATALGRTLGSEELLIRFLLGFVEDSGYAQLQEALRAWDAPAALAAATDLRERSESLAMGELSARTARVEELLEGEDLAAAAAEFPHVAREHRRVVLAICQCYFE